MSESVAAFDVGGTDIKIAVVTDGTIVERSRVATPGGTPGDGGGTADRAALVIDTIEAKTRELQQRHRIDALGVVIPGIVSDGVGVISENLGWHDVPFAEIFRERIGLPLGFGHDVRAAALAEARLGAAGDGEVVCVLVIGTGIAATILLDGNPLESGGWAGEVGHSIVVPGGERCACGGRGCLEAVASASAIARRYSAISGTEVAGAREVLAAAEAGDEDARTVWADAVEALARGIHQLTAIVAPERIVIAGGLSAAGPALLEPLQVALEAKLTGAQRPPELRIAELREDAGLLGAAILGAAAFSKRTGTAVA